MKFILNATLDVLPKNHNLHLWKKKTSPSCNNLCGEAQALLHVLNNCSTARNLRCYNHRHDLFLQEIASAIKPHLPSLSVDISEGYQFPRHIVVWWDCNSKSVCIAELTVYFESHYRPARLRRVHHRIPRPACAQIPVHTWQWRVRERCVYYSLSRSSWCLPRRRLYRFMDVTKPV